MDLVDKWTTEGKINDENKNTLATYWKKFEEYIHPQTNQLIAVVELKWLFQGTLSLEDFHTKCRITDQTLKLPNKRFHTLITNFFLQP